MTDWIVALMGRLGSPGAGLLVALESIFPPIPSGLILPLAGLLLSAGYALGSRWEVVQTLVGRFQEVVVALVVLALVVVVVRRVRESRADRARAGRLVP